MFYFQAWNFFWGLIFKRLFYRINDKSERIYFIYFTKRYQPIKLKSNLSFSFIDLLLSLQFSHFNITVNRFWYARFCIPTRPSRSGFASLKMFNLITTRIISFLVLLPSLSAPLPAHYIIMSFPFVCCAAPHRHNQKFIHAHSHTGGLRVKSKRV